MSGKQPEAAELEAEVEETEEEIEEVHEKIEDPQTDPAEREQLQARLDKLEQGQAKMLEKLESLAASPVAPAPPRKVADPPAAAPEEKPEDDGKPKERKHRYGSTAWFKDRAYEE